MKTDVFFWLCVGAGVCAALALIALSARLTTDPTVLEPTVEPPIVRAGADRAALRDCGLQAQPDEACRELWAANRRHFLGLDVPASASGDQP
jgi:conjugative transfer region protein TrbK